MAENIEASGWITTWMVLEFILGKMVESIKESIKTTRNMDLEFMCGPMAGFTKVTGTKENSTV